MCFTFLIVVQPSLSLKKRISSLMVKSQVARAGPIMEASLSGIPCAAFTKIPVLLFFLLIPLPYILKPNATMHSSSTAASNAASDSTARSWSISDDSLRRYVLFASESCIQELLSASDAGRDGDGWKVLAFDDGVEIAKRPSGPLHVFRSRWLLRSVSPEQFITVANAIDAAKQWDTQLVEGRYIKDLTENLSIVWLRFGDASKTLFRNREFTVYERRETMDDGTLVVAVASLPKEIAAGLQPKRNNSIRGFLLQSGWVVEKLGDDSCLVTYVIQGIRICSSAPMIV